MGCNLGLGVMERSEGDDSILSESGGGAVHLSIEFLFLFLFFVGLNLSVEYTAGGFCIWTRWLNLQLCP